VAILQDIFSPRYGPGAYDEILDVLDMTLGVYDAGFYSAVIRTVNPLHYLGTVLTFVAGLPRRALATLGLVRPRVEPATPEALRRVEAALARLDGVEEVLDRRFAELREWQSRVSADGGQQVTDVAERVDFLERVLAQQRQLELKPGPSRKTTPV
jgi:hypothetical protein